jgi:hypothetical protein
VSAPDLRAGPPRRWNTAIDGVIWLPRIVDKARAFDAGTLGDYLFGQSPLDDAFLRAARIEYGDFLEIVRTSADDASVFAKVCARSPEMLGRLRRFSTRMPARIPLILHCIDLDDGYASSHLKGVIVPVVRGGANAVARLIRVFRPDRARPQALTPEGPRA